jgi:hypothetical protein
MLIMSSSLAALSVLQAGNPTYWSLCTCSHYYLLAYLKQLILIDKAELKQGH